MARRCLPSSWFWPFWKCRKLLQWAFLASPLDITIESGPLWRNRPGYGFMTACQPVTKDDGTAGELLLDTQKLRRQSSYHCRRCWVDRNHHLRSDALKKAVSYDSGQSHLTGWCGQYCGSFSPHQNIVSGILDTVAYNVARKNKDLALCKDWKSLEQTDNQRRLAKWNQQLFFCIDRFSRWKRLPNYSRSVDFFMLRESRSPLCSLGSWSDPYSNLWNC